MRPEPLGTICEFKYGSSLPERFREPGSVPVFGSNGRVGFHSTAYTDGAAIIIGRKGSIGEINYSPEPCWPIDTTYFIDRTSTKHDLRWLSYALSNLRLNELNKATGVPGLNRNDAYAKVLIVPPLDEQRRIAAILDQADALRRKRREALARLDQLKQAIFIDMFGDPVANTKGWPIGTIEKLSKSTQYGTSSRADEKGSLPILRMGNLTYSGEMDFSDLKYIDLPERDIEKFTVRDGDILFNRTNSAELVGKTAIFRGVEKCAYAGYLVRLRVNEKADPEYVCAFLNSPFGKAVLRGMCKSIIGMANINAKELQTIRLPIPPVDLQIRFAKVIKNIGLLKNVHRIHLSELDALFASLQDRAFRGEL